MNSRIYKYLTILEIPKIRANQRERMGIGENELKRKGSIYSTFIIH